MARQQIALHQHPNKVLPNGDAFIKGTLNDASEPLVPLYEGPPDLDIEPEAAPVETPENFLALYFKEMAPLPVLQPDEEFESARRIERVEIALWTQILSHPQLIDMVLTVFERGLENSLEEFGRIRRSARAMHDKAKTTDRTRRRYQEQCEQLAKRIHMLDIDRRLLLAIMKELHLISRAAKGRIFRERIPVNTKSKSFIEYYETVKALFATAQRTRNEFVKSNLRLVVSIARRFNHGRMPLSDLIQEGNIGLIKAVERYDYRRGYRFSTYASWWIRHAISRALADKGRAVRLPVHMLDAYHKVARTTQELSTKLGRPPTTEEICFSAGFSLDKVQKIQCYLLDQSFSLDRVVSEDDSRRFIEMLQDPDGLSATEKILDQSVSDQVQQIIGDLKPIEADVLRKRFGLEGAREQTLKEIGDSYRLSRERIRQIQEQALLKIRRGLQRRNVL